MATKDLIDMASLDGTEVTRTITDFLGNEYSEYSKYVISSRALPSLVDGFKTGARKIMHAAFKGSLKDGKPKKVPNLSGETLNYSLYPHGDMSLNGTIITLSQQFRFNLNPLYIDGQNGTLRTPKAAASSRYLYVQLSKYAKIWQTDYELLDFIFDEGQYVEPTYYLPIIPVVLANMQTGMSPGYKFQTMNYNPIDIIDCCLFCLSGKKLQKKENNTALFGPNEEEKFPIHPFIRGIKKENWKLEDEKWVNYGEYEINEPRDVLIVKDLPYDVTFEEFEKLLNKMIEKGKIKDWKNLSSGNTLEYHIQYYKTQLQALASKKDFNNYILGTFKLKKVVPDDLLWVIDENNKVKHFECPQDLVKYFVNFRLSIYTKRKDRLVKIMQERLDKNSEMVKFINLVCDNKLKLKNRPIQDVKADLEKFKLPIELVNTPMSKVTKEEKDKLLQENQDIKEQLKYLIETTEKKMYVNDLKQLRKELVHDFE